jgi:hypothetical protein
LPVFGWLYIRGKMVICDLLLVICDYFLDQNKANAV